MKLGPLPIGAIDWSDVPAVTGPGETGTQTVRTRELGDIKLRLVAYSAGYCADHWCAKGHLVYVVDGHLTLEHEDGTQFALGPGMSWHAPDQAGPPHRVVTERGATIFIVD